ncbi:putative enoyl-CoA hydratase [Ruditapes philippinarum]|uniref:putative enoyl-CoA hydratase n=1 Tax=Ruditapes philippinarum TaxID=129788 RepID=UPI00295A9889|nr:putative enoyl-CoA hydratase [Ruditapes philippinarum]
MAEGLKMVTSGDGIATVHMCNGENRFRMSFVKAWMKILDEIERNDAIKGVIITGADNFFSLGLDVTFLSAQTPEHLAETRASIRQFYKRLTLLPVPTVAAINGHCFGAGAFLALACDYRVMRSDRGWLCWPEVALNMRIHQSNIHLLRMKVPSGKSLRDAVLFGKRLSARDSRDLQLVDVISSQQSLSDDATKLLFEVLGKNGIDRKSLKQTKEDIYCFPEHLFVESTAKL